MTTVNTKSGRIIKVVSREEEKSTLTESDTEMDERAVEAVKAAINKARICKKPIAGYDKEKKRSYVEHANGERKYPEQKTDDSCFSRTKWLREKYNNNFFDKVVERYYKSINNIKELLNIWDIMHVYDNTKTPERIIRKHKDELSIYPNEYWSEQDILGLME